MRFVPIGVGDAFTALHYTQSIVVEAEGVRLLVDCPHPIRKMLREADLDIGDLHAVAVTHLHADHSSGLEGFGYFSYFALKRKAHLVMHPAVSARLWSGHLAAGMEHLMHAAGETPREHTFDDYFDLVALDEQKPVLVGPFSIECRRTIHHIPTTALRITAGGRTLGISADTAFDPALIEWLSAADLMIHETNFGVHTPYEKLAALPAQLRSKMRLIHYPDGFQARDIELLIQGRQYPV